MASTQLASNSLHSAALQPSTAQALEMAFKAFNELSGELNQTWQALEDQVRHLTIELEAANTQRLKELADKERIARRLQKLLQLLPGGVVVLNEKGKVTECNAAAVDLLGAPLEQQSWLDIIRQRFAPRKDDGHEISLVAVARAHGGKVFIENRKQLEDDSTTGIRAGFIRPCLSKQSDLAAGESNE